LSAPNTIRADLAHQRARRRGGWLRVLFGIVLVLLLGGGLVGLWAWRVAFAELPPIPDKAALWSLNRPPGVTFLDRSGQVIGIRGPRHGEAVSVRALPPYVVRAFLAAEDRRFYSHHGVDLQGIARALHADLGAGRVVQGGSTITQQVAKNLFLSPSQTLKRKLQEAALAWKIEHLMSKDEVLELYLNRIYFGAGAYGVDAAAEVYFGKPTRELTLPEAALLAALPKAPSRLALVDNLAAARARSRLVLAAMRQEGWISPGQERQAAMAPLALAPERPAEGDFGYVFDLAAARARQLTGGRVPDLVVRLTIDPALQHEASEAIRSVVRRGRRAGATQGALVALDQDGAVRALVGGVDHRDSPFARATQARRQPGSAFKPFVYAAAMAAGYTPSSEVDDDPIDVIQGRNVWSPSNYNDEYNGRITFRKALIKSANAATVRVSQAIGI
jgi:penicillin-binding protein 1A